jgi:cytochrome c556
MTRLAAFVVAAGAMMVTGSAFAQAKPEVLVKQRQAAMTLQGKYFFGQLRPMALGKVPYDAARAARAVEFLDALSKMPWDGFDPSTKDIKSATLPAAFTDTAKFKASQDLLQSEVAKLVAATKGGDEAAVKAQIGVVFKACGSCHQDFREKL